AQICRAADGERQPRLLSRIYRGRSFGRRRSCRGCRARSDAARLPAARAGREEIGPATLKSVCAELVEAPFFFWQRQRKERPFDKLRRTDPGWRVMLTDLPFLQL